MIRRWTANELSCGIFSQLLRTPHDLIWHMTGVIDFADEIRRFHLVLEDLGDILKQETPLHAISLEQLLQGPLADAMTHAGQLAMLRRVAGCPVPSENFIYAKIESGNLGQDQAQPAAPDPGWKPDLPPPAPGIGLPDEWYQK